MDEVRAVVYARIVAEVGIHEAKTHVSRLLRRRVEAGEEIAIRRGDTVVARLVPAWPTGKRALGMDAGRFEVPEDFDAPLDEETLATFEH